MEYVAGSYVRDNGLMHSWFLLSATSVCVCAHPRGYKLHSCDIEPVQTVEQICYV